MDQETMVFFDERLRDLTKQIAEETAQQFAKAREETAQQFAKAREETAQQFAKAREETAQQFAKLREETIRRFEQVEKRLKQFDKRFKQNDKRFENLEETMRHTRVLIEDLQSKIQLIAEQHSGLASDLERFQREATITFDQVKGWMEPYFRSLNARLLVLEKQAKPKKGSSSTVL